MKYGLRHVEPGESEEQTNNGVSSFRQDTSVGKHHHAHFKKEVVQPLTARDPEDCAPFEVSQPPQDEEQAFSWRSLLVKIVVSVTFFLSMTFLLEHFAKDKVTEVSEKLMDCIGLPGLFTIIFLADGLPQPFSYVPLIFMAVKGSVPKPMVFSTCAVASYSAGLVGYCVGSSIKARKIQCLEDFLKRNTGPAVVDMMTRKGALGVALAALLPIPLAVATWTAGYVGVDVRQFLPAPLCRIPKIALFVILSPSPDTAGAIIENTVVDS
uniref:Uncharacterized protein n=1 Tax=Alexandrium monilatum TaxID=311494 RepID=A0A7S4QAX0_9DINO|mmetsp:Transcript_980/g.3108  ORF Transcript_980/g.3108 Transcript_980/m.3108 type:complete len:267 (-) Transcript_980:38-838(-)